MNNMKYGIVILLSLAVFSCNRSPKSSEGSEVGEVKKSIVGFVDLTDPLEEDLVNQGAEIFSQKCSKCHTLDTVKFFVPSFAGVTNRRSPEWIMNMMLNPEDMLENDPTAKRLLEEHKIKMPEQELTVDQARGVLEFLRQNDLEQVGTKDEAAGK